MACESKEIMEVLASLSPGARKWYKTNLKDATTRCKTLGHLMAIRSEFLIKEGSE